ncbi:MAG TPA: peptide deformylase [Candidatus Paceibacterota bacterium]|nr:peptide deformylase [Candidatus Paceibacterota bacterium]
MGTEVVQEGAAVLREKAKPVPTKDIGSKTLTAVINRMKDTLKKESFGVAIAAPQIGESLRIFVIAGKAFDSDEEKKGFDDDDASQNNPSKKSSGLPAAAEVSGSGARLFSQDNSASRKTKRPDMVFINPVLTRLSKKKKEMSEGCLSVRGMYGTVMRHEKATVEALDENGKPFVYHGSGLIGHIFQHEVDHLEGILYIDKAVKLEEDDDLDGARKKLKDKHGI